VSLPESLRTLVDRFDGRVFDAPRGRARIRLEVAEGGSWDCIASAAGAAIAPAGAGAAPDARLRADGATWDRIAADLRGGMEAYRAGRLVVRHNLHLGVAFLAATSGATGPGRLEFQRIQTASGDVSILAAGIGDPVLLLHGLGATKGSFLPTVAALAGSFRTIAPDLPGFGDSFKPLDAPYHPPFFARSVIAVMDALGLERAHVVGNSMGGRVALELGLRYPGRIGRLVLLAPSLAWRRERPWAPFVRLLSPHLGLIQLTPRWAVGRSFTGSSPTREVWVRAGVDEFLRAASHRGRVAFRSGAKDLPGGHGSKGFWERRAARTRRCSSGKARRPGSVGFAAHVGGRFALGPTPRARLRSRARSSSRRGDAAIADFLARSMETDEHVVMGATS
jgi:pimeloyl-ACP methyl ester carboxylesterase